MVVKGFRFGMVLQFAIGPLCLFIFNIATLYGFKTALSAVIAVALIDGLEIILAILGISTFINKYNTAKKLLKYFGAAVLFAFGLNNIFTVFTGNMILLSYTGSTVEIFFYTLLLTLANPLTVVFWAGIFSVKINEENMRQKDLYAFALGCILATIFFLSLIGLAGSLTQNMLSGWIVNGLNILVGLFMILFAIRSLSTNTCN